MIYFFLIILGAAFGSFFNVCIYRIPRRESIVFPGSHCFQCNTKIKPADNIPILSYLFLKGKCRDCGFKIPIQYLLVEFLTPILFVLLYISSGFSINLVFFKYIIFISAGLIIFFIDYNQQIIPDVISLPLIIIGIAVSFLPAIDITWKSALCGAVFSFVVFLVTAYVFKLFTGKENLGGGDIKLMTAIGSFIGIAGTIFTIFFSSVIALIILILIGHDRRKEFPFGPFLILGAFLYILAGRFLTEMYLSLFRI